MLGRCVRISLWALALPVSAQSPVGLGQTSAPPERIAVHRIRGPRVPGQRHLARRWRRVRRALRRRRNVLRAGSRAACAGDPALADDSGSRSSAVGLPWPSCRRTQRWAQRDRMAIYAHAPAIEERFDVGVDGVEISWQFDHRPAGSGDLVVRYAIETGMPGPIATGDGGFGYASTGSAA